MRGLRFWAGAILHAATLSILIAAPIAAEGARSLTIEEAVARGLASDPGVLAAAMDERASLARAAEARYRMLPSLAISTGYTQLSKEPSFSLDNLSSSNQQALKPYMSTLQALMPVLADVFPSIDHSKDVRIDLQYPLFAGFRLREAARIAKLQSLGKDAAAELARQALVFDIRRSYWEAERATANVEALAKSLDLETVKREETTELSAQGMASEADRLDEDARYDQAVLALDDTKSGKELAFLVLATITGETEGELNGGFEYSLASVPGASVPPPAIAGTSDRDGGESLEVATLVERALANRPETRGAAIGLRVSEVAAKAAKSDLYPSLSLSGALSYADPDPRLFPSQDKFNLSWSLGARLRYDLGGVPGALERGRAAEADLAKARADLARSRNAIALDVRKCALALERSRDSLKLTRGMVRQAEEGRRVADRKFENGMANRSEVLQAEMALIRSNLAVTNKLVDLEIAQADLLRALGLE
jgi:outer membrane protein